MAISTPVCKKENMIISNQRSVSSTDQNPYLALELKDEIPQVVENIDNNSNTLALGRWEFDIIRPISYGKYKTNF
jgi:hypothetical protein